MAKFVKQPLVIDAWQLPDPSSNPGPRPPVFPEDMPKEVMGKVEYDGWSEGKTARAVYSIDSAEGRMHAYGGDWVIRGVEGEVYACRDSVFRKTYMPEEAPPGTSPLAAEAGSDRLASSPEPA